MIRTSLIYGFIIWLIPFVLSFLFYDRAGNILIDEAFANTVYVFAFFLLLLFFSGRFIVKFSDWKKKNIILFSSLVFWVGIVMDFIFLVQMFEVELIKFLLQIVPIYLLSFGVGYFAVALIWCLENRS